MLQGLRVQGASGTGHEPSDLRAHSSTPGGGGVFSTRPLIFEHLPSCPILSGPDMVVILFSRSAGGPYETPMGLPYETPMKPL